MWKKTENTQDCGPLRTAACSTSPCAVTAYMCVASFLCPVFPHLRSNIHPLTSRANSTCRTRLSARWCEERARREEIKRGGEGPSRFLSRSSRRGPQETDEEEASKPAPFFKDLILDVCGLLSMHRRTHPARTYTLFLLYSIGNIFNLVLSFYSHNLWCFAAFWGTA